MATKLIAYDLNAPGQNYDDLIKEIKEIANGYWHHLDSTWLIGSTLTTTAIRDRLAKHIDSGDEILVVDVTGDARAWQGFNTKGSAWLKNSWD